MSAKKNKWNSRSTILSLLGLIIVGVFLFVYIWLIKYYGEIVRELVLAGKEVPPVFTEAIRIFPIGWVVLGGFSIPGVTIAGNKIIRGIHGPEEKDE